MDKSGETQPRGKGRLQHVNEAATSRGAHILLGGLRIVHHTFNRLPYNHIPATNWNKAKMKPFNLKGFAMRIVNVV